MTTDQTPAVEVLARLLCAADVHVHDGDHPSWQQLRVAQHGRGQDDYRKAARWLLPRMTVATKPAAVPVPLSTQADRRAQLLDALDFAYCQGLGFDTPEALLVAYDASRAVPVPPPADQPARRDRIADAVRSAACPGDCGNTEEECARERIQPFAWHYGRLAIVEGTPEQFADAVLAVLPEQTDRAADTFAVIRPQTLTALASHIDARSVAILRPESQTYAEWQTMAALLRRVAAEEQPAETHSCRNCEGIDPDTCLMNPDRPKRPPMDPVHILGIDGPPCIPDHGVAVYCPGCADSEEQAAETQDALPAWLYQRFMPDGVGWENLDADDRSYWEHYARAVRRAVARGGFKAARPAVGEQPEPPHLGGNAEDCPACRGTNPPYPFLCPGPDAP